MKKQTQEEEYKAMGFPLMPSGRINHHLWYGRKFGHASAKDSTWKYDGFKTFNKFRNSENPHKYPVGSHVCCGSRKAYCHKTGCKNRIELDHVLDDLSDLKG